MICAIDCDLRTSYCVTNAGKSNRAADPQHALKGFGLRPTDTVLFEIASPVSFNRGGQSSAIMHNLAKWAIWNVAQATMLDANLRRINYPGILVAPSNVWTKGHDLKTRHMIAGCKQPKKDLREAEAMIWFYRKDPSVWLPLPQYLQTL
jgi:hypothetical protein